ncbi:MAG: hypothetical protein WCB56_07820 [Terriglobales bacterium]|jgi:hypothetical protein
MKKLGFVFVVLTIALMLGGNAFAQGDNSVYFTTYFANNVSAAPDATIRFINDGDTAGNLWAAIYVFDNSQELQACGACEITPDGLLSESLKTELTNNPLTGKAVPNGVIKVISSSSLDPTATTPVAGLRGWATHIQSSANKYPEGPAPYVQTETAFHDSNLVSAEQTLLQNLCYYAQLLGSGTGTISCTPEDRDF